MKLKILVGDWDEEGYVDGDSIEWRDFYTLGEYITSCYTPDLNEDVGKGIVIGIMGYPTTVKQEPHLIDFLIKKFNIKV